MPIVMRNGGGRGRAVTNSLCNFQQQSWASSDVRSLTVPYTIEQVFLSLNVPKN